MPEVPDALKQSVAIHEAGHIVLAIAMKVPFKYATLKPMEGLDFAGHVALDTERIIKEMEAMSYADQVNYLARIAYVAVGGEYADRKILNLEEAHIAKRCEKDLELFEWLANRL